MNIENTTLDSPNPKIMNPAMKCHECGRPRELKVDKPATLAGASKGVRVRPMAVQRNRGRPRKRLRKDYRDVTFY